MKAWARFLAALLATASLIAPGRAADDITVTARQILRFQGAEPGGRVGGLVWRGGIEMRSTDDRFGGLSGMGFIGGDNRLVMVTDHGNFIAGQLLHDAEGRPEGLIATSIEPMRNSSGAILPRRFSSDAEALAVVERDGVPVAVRVGFENLTRVADFQLRNGMPGGAAREVNIPAWLTQTRTNETIEALCIAPPASPVAGSTLILTEGVQTSAGHARGHMLGVRDRGPVSYAAGPGTKPTDCAFLPNGDLLVVERGIALFAFRMTLRRVPAAQVRPDTVLRGETLLEVTGGDIDNMESVAVYAAPDGETRIAIGSDNNFNDWQRHLLLTFALPD